MFEVYERRAPAEYVDVNWLSGSKTSAKSKEETIYYTVEDTDRDIIFTGISIITGNYMVSDSKNGVPYACATVEDAIHHCRKLNNLTIK